VAGGIGPDQFNKEFKLTGPGLFKKNLLGGKEVGKTTLHIQGRESREIGREERWQAFKIGRETADLLHWLSVNVGKKLLGEHLRHERQEENSQDKLLKEGLRRGRQGDLQGSPETKTIGSLITVGKDSLLNRD